ncbi:hypothetical protein SAMD00019534_061400, partial [Acytostelium subglobosum LB1]|uniref:hypothetical protein n=1 Tax=Acytostelium subglobosum LB1 TaxID=1410327 RepID=UPI0006448332
MMMTSIGRSSSMMKQYSKRSTMTSLLAINNTTYPSSVITRSISTSPLSSHITTLSSNALPTTTSRQTSIKSLQLYSRLLQTTLPANRLYFSTAAATTQQTQTQPQTQPQTETQQQQQQTKPEKPKTVSKFSFMRKGYFNLVKFPISAYVTFTTVAGYVMTAPIVDPVTLGLLSFGTFMSSASACAHNQEMEVRFDAKMPRTKSRPLVTGEIKLDTGFIFALVSGVVGCGTLVFVHPVCAGLAMSNIFIYILYTHMKRTTSFNTWVGAIVGAIPPLIGTVAGAREFEAIGGLLATVLFIWQIPHFLALAEKLKSQYAAAGYKMLPVTHPTWNYPVSVAHAVAGVIAPLAFYYTYDLNMSLFTVLAFSASSFVMGLEAVLEHRYKQKIIEAAANGVTLPPQSRKRGVFFLSLIMLPLSLIIGMFLRLPYEYYYEKTNDKTGETKEVIRYTSAPK